MHSTHMSGLKGGGEGGGAGKGRGGRGERQGGREGGRGGQVCIELWQVGRPAQDATRWRQSTWSGERDAPQVRVDSTTGVPVDTGTHQHTLQPRSLDVLAQPIVHEVKDQPRTCAPAPHSPTPPHPHKHPPPFLPPSLDVLAQAASHEVYHPLPSPPCPFTPFPRPSPAHLMFWLSR
jgi:hypothetical protein